MTAPHPSDDIANNLDTLFVSPDTAALSPDKQTRIAEVVDAARVCADQYLATTSTISKPSWSMSDRPDWPKTPGSFDARGTHWRVSPSFFRQV